MSLMENTDTPIKLLTLSEAANILKIFQTNCASHDPDRADSCIKGRRSMANFEKSIKSSLPKRKKLPRLMPL